MTDDLIGGEESIARVRFSGKISEPLLERFCHASNVLAQQNTAQIS